MSIVRTAQSMPAQVSPQDTYHPPWSRLASSLTTTAASKRSFARRNQVLDFKVKQAFAALDVTAAFVVGKEQVVLVLCGLAGF